MQIGLTIDIYFDSARARPYDCAAMAWVHPQDTVDVPLAARRNASYECDIHLDSLSPSGAVADDIEPLGRLAAAVSELVAVRSRFGLSLDDYGRPCLSGQATATVVMPCQRCLEGVTLEITAELAQVIWFGAEPPGELVEAGVDVMLSASSEISYAALIEDDLLLALPQQICQDQNCARLPVLAYPAPGYRSGNESQEGAREEPAEVLADDRQRPFAGLKDLLQSSSED